MVDEQNKDRRAERRRDNARHDMLNGLVQSRYSKLHKEVLFGIHGTECFLCGTDLTLNNTRVVHHMQRGKQDAGSKFLLCTDCYAKTEGQGIIRLLRNLEKEYKDKLVLLPVRIQAVQDKLSQVEQRNIST